jgi:hypothetical protein
VRACGLALLACLAFPPFAVAAQTPPTAAAQPADASQEQVFIKPATIDNTLEVTGDTVAAKEVNTRMQVGVLVNGKGPYRFFVDSGADRSVIGQALAIRLGLPTGPMVILHSTGSAREVSTVHIDSLSVGTSLIHDIAAPALPERFLGGDGMLGIDALIDQRLTIDFDKKTVVVQDTHRPEPTAGPYEVVITARRRKGQLILTQANAGIPLAAVIDTGTEITVGNSALRAKLLRHRQAPVMTTTLISVTGDMVPADLLPVPEIRIGDLILHNVLIAFSDVPPFKLFGLDHEPAILLGTDILSSFRRVSLDFRRRKVRFTLRPDSR